jgi:uncharacterized repeat protein (TIGR01451 family)
MKKLLVLLAVLTLVVAASADSWTIMVWLNNQSNLASYGHDDLNEMEVADYSQYGDGVDVICLLGTTGGSYTQNAKLYHVDYDSQNYDGSEGMSHVVSTEITGHGIWSGTLDMDNDIDAFEDFVEWTVTNYPADNYLISAWDHGSGIWMEEEPSWLDKGACGNLKIWDFEQALKNAGTYIDVLGYDVCLLGQIETGYQMEDNVVGIQLGSQRNEPGEGWDYEAFTIFETDSDITPDELAIRIVEDYLDFYSPGQTQAAADVKNWDTIMESDWDTFCHELFDNCYAYESAIVSARNSASYFNTSEDRDIYDFVTAIAANSSLPSSLQTAASNVEAALEDYILAGGMHDSGDPGGGMSIWFPTNGSNNYHWSSYQSNLDFSDTYWDEFLDMYRDPHAVDPVMIAVDSVSFDDSAGNGDGELNPGETITATVTLINSGTDTATNVNGTLTISDSYFNVTSGSGSYGSITSNGTASADFVFEVLAGCPEPYSTTADLAVTADGGYSEALSFDIDVAEGGSGIESAELFADAREEGILLSWSAEGDILGYNLLREGSRINDALLSSNSFLDASVVSGEEYSYELEVVDLNGTVVTFGPISVFAMGEAALRTTLGHNYPSPVVSSTVIPFELAADSRVELSVYDLSGRLVETLVAGEMSAGRHSVTWNAEGNAAGIYLIQLKTDEQMVTSRAVISR